MSKIKIVGLGPGSTDYILPVATKAIQAADLLVGSRRSLEAFDQHEVYYYHDNLSAMVEMLERERHSKNIVVVVTGDPGFYSLLDYIEKHLGKEALEVIPGISSFQYLFSRLGKSYKDYGLYSLHGRTLSVKEQLEKHKGLFLLTDGQNTPSAIAKTLVEAGFSNCTMVVGENLSYPEEQIVQGKVQDFIERYFSTLCVVVIENEMD